MKIIYAGACALILSCTSCIGVEWKEDLAQFERDQTILLEQYKAGAISYEQLVEVGAQLRKEFGEEMQENVDETATQVKELIHTATNSGPITGNPLLDTLLALAGTALAGGVGANQWRDRKRKLRGEPTGGERVRVFPTPRPDRQPPDPPIQPS